jgi:NADP-reducing hydrogenase subunit HndB
MAILKREDLKKLREEKKKEFSGLATADLKTRIIVGMGTCGIAAGAKDTLDSMKDEIEKYSIDGVIITQTGCMGLCYAEPTVEVLVHGMPDIVYGNVDSEAVKSIVTKHVLGKELVEALILDKRSIDIVRR